LTRFANACWPKITFRAARSLLDDPRNATGGEASIGFLVVDEASDVGVGQRSGDVKDAAVLAVVPDRQYVRVEGEVRQLRLAFEALAELVAAREAGLHDLDGRRPVIGLVTRGVDDGHAPAADQTGDPKAPGDDRAEVDARRKRGRHVRRIDNH
jgi:hypothetical protein